MSLRPAELTAVAAELNRELSGGVIQKVYAPTTTRVYAELRVPGRSVTLLWCSENGVARVSAVEARPPNPATPPTWQSVLRRELTGAKVLDVEAVPQSRCLVFHLGKGERTLTWLLEASGTPGLALLTRDGTIVTLSNPFRPAFRVGATWAPPPTGSSGPVSDSVEPPSRLASDHVFLRLAHGAEALFAQVEQVTWRKAQTSPLEGRLKKIERTRQKVKADAARLEGARDFQREGTLLAQNSHRVARGQKSVTLTDYLPDGQVVERVIALDPKRSLKEEVEHRFHQYRRLERGAALAAERLAELDAEEAAVRAELERVRAVSADDVNSQLAANVTHASSTAAAVRKAKAAREGRPYREYLGHAGRRIWVGRGSKHNDALTFQVAKPFHLWLHALGVPGAHVVVPLERNETISAELLIDAAHLALHHSDFKGEPRGEVSSVPVKFVRKGAAPGAVTYTREKNIMVRVEPERLKRLLANEVE